MSEKDNKQCIMKGNTLLKRLITFSDWKGYFLFRLHYQLHWRKITSCDTLVISWMDFRHDHCKWKILCKVYCSQNYFIIKCFYKTLRVLKSCCRAVPDCRFEVQNNCTCTNIGFLFFSVVNLNQQGFTLNIKLPLLKMIVLEQPRVTGSGLCHMCWPCRLAALHMGNDYSFSIAPEQKGMKMLSHYFSSNHQKVLNNQWPTLRVFHPPGCCRVHCEYCKITGKWDIMRNTI